MKKYFYSVLAASMLFACSQEEIVDVNQSESQQVTFKVEVPGVSHSRAIAPGIEVGAGKYADRLLYAMYEEGHTDITDILVAGVALDDDKNGIFEVNVPMAKDIKYDILFLAYNPGNNIFGISADIDTEEEAKTVDMRALTLKQDLLANQESYDAFIGSLASKGVDAVSATNVPLYRPFAQVNAATTLNDLNDADKLNAEVTKSYIKVTNAPTKLNVFNGAVSEPNTFEYKLAGILNKDGKTEYPYNETITVGTDTYYYLAMAYVLAGNTSTTCDADFSFYRADSKLVSSLQVKNMPIQANYRTNVLGTLLTQKEKYEIKIDAEFGKPNDVIYLWDGETVKEPAFDATTNQYAIEYASELAWLAAAVNGTLPEGRSAVKPQSFAGKTFVLTKDVDLGGHEWTPIGYGKHFEGSFDGQGYTISNFKITMKKNKSNNNAALFGSIAGNATIKNFTVDNAQVLYPGVEAGDFYGAAVVATVYGTHRFEGINVINSTIQGNNKVAGLIAHDGGASSITINNCRVERCTIETKNRENGGNVAGMVGYLATNGVVISNSSVKFCTINAINSSDEGKRANSQFIGAIHGGKTLIIDDCAIQYNQFNETGRNTYVSPYDVDFIGGARNDATADVVINGTSYLRSLPESITLDETSSIVLKSLEADHGVTLSGKGTLILDGVTITAASGSAITLAEGADVTLQICNAVSLTGATNGIEVAEGRTLTVQGEGTLTTIGNAGSGIGAKGANAGTITIEGLAHITANGKGDHAFGIGGNGADVAIKNSTVDYACGGHIQPLFVNDTNYGKSEPEGGAGIGGATIQIEGSTITKVDGGSKAAAIGAQYWQSTEIVIMNSTILEANGGNASAGIGGSRYADKEKYSVSIKIEESTITATGGQGGAGIGSGYDTHCNGQDYTATNHIEIDGASTITATGGKYAAGIGTGFHSAYLSGSIAEGATINAESPENFYKDKYSTAQNIGYGVVDPAREFSGVNSNVTFKVNGQLIAKPIEFPVAKVGETSYNSIDEAIAAWTNNTTLTLLNNVTLSDVITIKSTEHHILNLGTFTMTAAEGKNAFVIKACGTGDAERFAITIKADANNPGGINAGNKCIIYYKYADGGISGNDRPIIKIEGGVFTGSTSSWGTAGIYTIGTEARKCATLNISGGTFNCSINGSGKSKLLISGGVFHYSVGSQGDSTALRLISGGTFKTLGFMTADSNNTKFWFGTSMANSNVGLYINDEGYLVVGGPVITEFGDKFTAKATNPTKWSSYLQYSSAANGLYYTNADKAIANHGAANVELK